MPIIFPSCAGFDLLAEVPCVRLPGGAELCFAVPGIVPTTQFEAGSAALGAINSALAPLAPVFDVLDVVKTVIDTIKALATLNPEEIAKALPTLISQVADLATLFPPLSVPVFIFDLLKVIALVLEGLANELDAAAAYGARLANAANIAAAVPGVALALECGQGHLSLVLQHLGGQLGPLNRLIGLLNGFLELAGLGRFKIPCIAALDPGNLAVFSDVLRALAGFMRALTLQLPQPGGVKSRVVPCP